ALEDAGVALVHVAGRHRVPRDRVPDARLQCLSLRDVTAVVIHVFLSCRAARASRVGRTAEPVDNRAATALTHDLAARAATGRVSVALDSRDVTGAVDLLHDAHVTHPAHARE